MAQTTTQYIAVANLKGGVGKSTVAVNLACALTSRTKRAVLIDADRQGTSSFWGESGALPVETLSLPLDDQIESQGLVTRILGDRRKQDYTRARSWILQLQRIDAAFVVIDCPPQVGLATRAAITAADLVIVPVTGTAADLAATMPALALVREVRKARLSGGPDCLVLPTRIDRTSAAGRRVEAVLRQLGEPLGPAIGQRATFADSVAFGQWVGDYAPNSRAHQEVTKLSLRVKRILGTSTKT